MTGWRFAYVFGGCYSPEETNVKALIKKKEILIRVIAITVLGYT